MYWLGLQAYRSLVPGKRYTPHEADIDRHLVNEHITRFPVQESTVNSTDASGADVVVNLTDGLEGAQRKP